MGGVRNVIIGVGSQNYIYTGFTPGKSLYINVLSMRRHVLLFAVKTMRSNIPMRALPLKFTPTCGRIQ